MAALAAASACAPSAPAPGAPPATPPGPRRPATVSANPFGAPTGPDNNPGSAITAVPGSRISGWPQQTRSELLARNGVVATSHPLAAQAGLRILQEGGNSADAAIATAAILGLVEPESAGIGGDSFAIHYSAADRRLYGLNSAGWAPSGWTPDYFRSRGHTDPVAGMPYTGVDSVTVPGAVDGWDQLLKRFGSRGFDAVLAPAIELAEEGFGLTERIHSDWVEGAELLAKDPDSAKTFLVNGKAPALYSLVRNPDLANAYRVLARGGRDVFYRGEIAAAILEKNGRLGGALRAEDLADFQAEWVDPIQVNYQGYDVHQLPPNTQGFATLIMLGVIDQFGPVLGYDLAQLGPRAPQFWHLLIEAKKLAYSDLHRYNGDPRFVKVPLDMLLSKQHAADLCGKIDPNKATPPSVKASATHGTVYLTTADRWGNMTSFIYSIYDTFGSGLTVPGFGFPLHNRGALFSLDPASTNIVAPRKRPFHTLVPAFVTKDGRPVLSFGNMGGNVQAQAQATELVEMINLGMNPQAAGDAARFNHHQFKDSVGLEPALHELVGGQLAAMGHKLQDPKTTSAGGYQAIHFTPAQPGEWPGQAAPNGPVNGIYRAASDHRKDGAAVGW
ncbi:gamma-glutamyltranspeptidase/glutathione hydrolase [Pseudonocardia eucalypti]|uniref:gamma-glutamyltransferase n=1 Tax=Pseudonocardia eucalypti TaxID=648755 RepID=UPI001813957F|nr:gamma-glutamyltranspeptidase/glutathione hydrolase [Pseudonocardia eucalypti]